MVTHLELEPEILECEVRWALGSNTINKASGDDGISTELFKILKEDAIKVPHSICQQIWKTQPWPQDWKKEPQRKAMLKNVQTITQLHSFHMLAMLKIAVILQVRLQQYVNGELPDVQAGFRKRRGTRDPIISYIIYYIILYCYYILYIQY